MAPRLFGYYLCLSVLSAVRSYEYGYHPSSEEFDNQMRKNTWTNDILWYERNKPTFTPIFNLRKQKHVSSNSDHATGYNTTRISESALVKNKYIVQVDNTTDPMCLNKTLTDKVHRLIEIILNKNNNTRLSLNRRISRLTKNKYEKKVLKKAYKKCFRKINHVLKNSTNVDSTKQNSAFSKKKKVRNPARLKPNITASKVTLSTQLEKPGDDINLYNLWDFHIISKRSLNDSEGKRQFKTSNLNLRKANFSKPIPSSKYRNQTKKAFVTKIQMTNEYIEPATKATIPKSSTETKIVPTQQKVPCNKPKQSKLKSHESYDYSDSDEISYSEYLSSIEDNDYQYSSDIMESQSDKNKLRNEISEYDSLENNHLTDHDLRDAIKRRIKRKRPDEDFYDEYDENYENDYDENNLSIFDFFHDIYVPIQWMIDRVFQKTGYGSNEEVPQKINENRKPKYPQYTIYNSNTEEIKAEEEDKKSVLSWITSIFKFMKGSSWFGSDVKASNDNDDDDGPWFFGWFNTKQRSKRTTTTTSTTTSIPILTIADPLHEPKKWIGLLAQHIINSTANPLQEKNNENSESPKQISYNKYQIWRLKPKDYFQVKSLTKYKDGTEGGRLQWLRGPTLRGLNDVLISPKMLNLFQTFLKYENIAYEIIIYDVGKVILYEKDKQNEKENSTSGYKRKTGLSWNAYYDFNSIVRYLETIQVQNPELVELIHIGRSYEGRPLIIVKLHSKMSGDRKIKKDYLKFGKKSEHAKGVFIEAGVHGREWIAPASATWIINEVLKIMKHNHTDSGTDYIKETTWYIMPVANPDSYEYSRMYDRFWKKTRSRHVAKANGLIHSALTWLQQKKDPERICFGVDYDLNWFRDWEKKSSSKSPCNEFFAGPKPFSEPETQAIAKFLIESRKHIKLFISLQAYGQTISYPNKLNSTFQAQNNDDLLEVAMVGIDELRKHGRSSRYKIDSTNDFIEYKSGSSEYFTSLQVEIPFSYTIYLSDNGVHGFILPSTYIEPTAKDAFHIIKAMFNYI